MDLKDVIEQQTDIVSKMSPEEIGLLLEEIDTPFGTLVRIKRSLFDQPEKE